MHWTYDQRIVHAIGLINQGNERFFSGWVHRGIDHWLKGVAFAAIPMLLMALQVFWEDGMAMASGQTKTTSVPLRQSRLLSALTAAPCRP